MYVLYCTRVCSKNTNTNTLKPYLPQHDLPTACVIAQQYSSKTFVSLCFYYCKEKFGAPYKNIISYFCNF
jgi:hypothetical protein